MRLTSRSLTWLKLVFHVLALSPLVYLFLSVASGNQGGDPSQYIIQYTGVGALNALAITLLVSPVAKYFKQALLMQTRRMLGLYVFFYASLHVMGYLSLYLLFDWSMMFTEIVKRPYLVLGGISYLIVLSLAVTSFKGAMSFMGKRWKQLHNCVYLVAVLIPIHYFWSVKSGLIEPSLYLIGFSLFLIWVAIGSKWYKQRVMKKFKKVSMSFKPMGKTNSLVKIQEKLSGNRG